MDSSTVTNSHWYAIHTHLNQEIRTGPNLKAWNVKTFFPKIKETRCNQFSGALTSLTKPFFPRYLFARLILNNYTHEVWFTRGVQSGTAVDLQVSIMNMFALKVKHVLSLWTLVQAHTSCSV